MTENIISWNVANWVTVILMALLGYAVFILIAKTIHIRGENADA